jgi:hypothetical protein
MAHEPSPLHVIVDQKMSTHGSVTLLIYDSNPVHCRVQS